MNRRTRICITNECVYIVSHALLLCEYYKHPRYRNEINHFDTRLIFILYFALCMSKAYKAVDEFHSPSITLLSAHRLLCLTMARFSNT